MYINFPRSYADIQDIIKDLEVVLSSELISDFDIDEMKNLVSDKSVQGKSNNEISCRE